ncbi:23S rRNA (uracil(1939)-C(5))-methyltransferase RlmD [Paenibacillus sp. LHD-117]|uniref:23S rRNA (uracil(1939)-C(5))-methyltransferase RlmD n=1 Tax=Paenibacillus sp. LHD-117 TaxID=3071412 RepID=UPI0027E1E2CF|nr:23S rRNA (uracil(1939)-C(5))-methyltransferase RlmD [Paenibacillus sp. LHD-117]MDQ6422523.1 23S rRNA (uracil(1939)-C(5))-methyltransferase RlmD [Paenibacillus sp. LHD-117]
MNPAKSGGRPARVSSAPAKEHDGPFAKNEQVTLDVIGLTHDGEGVGRADGFTLFVQGALPGEQVNARVMKMKKQYGYARLEKLLTESPDRLNPPCDIYKECGGCQLQHFDYEAQLAWKRQHVIDNLTRIGKLTVRENEGDRLGSADFGVQAERQGIVVHPTIGMDDPWRYRNKAAVPIGAAGEGGELVAGFYARGTHRIIDMDDCLIQHEHNDEVLRVVKRVAKELRIQPYDEQTGQGVLRHVMARTGVVTGEIMVVLVTNGKRLPRQPEWIEALRAGLPGLKSIVQNVNTRDTNVIFGDETRTLWGSDVIYDELDGIRFAISARSFYQVNPAQTVALYGKAVEYAALTGNENVIDAYCGIGTISLFLARKAGHVYGVEIVPEAIEDAKRNAALNGIDNATFEAGPAEVVIPRWRKEGAKADVIVVDPPRKGCDPALLETILQMEPERVVYVSCNPSTLARDLRVLEDGGYRTVEVTPVDMFPWTVHVESVAVLVLD